MAAKSSICQKPIVQMGLSNYSGQYVLLPLPAQSDMAYHGVTLDQFLFVFHQIAKEQKAADLAAKQLIEEEQREQAKAAAKQARKQRKKAKQKLVVHEDLSEDQPQHSESLIQNLESDPDVDAASAAAPVQPNATLQTSADTGFADEHVASIKMKAKLAPDPAAPAEEPSVNRKSNPDMDFLNKLSCCPITQVMALCMLPTQALIWRALLPDMCGERLYQSLSSASLQ